ncbi:MAG: Rieske 2Fe-2S domain-containing protein [Planctomycetes bacterium]|jgi:phenylpropionate dioxygenase-like ring-hydroxylating dioxygenase large terminal subunit|nr:Rieske 2Fe-2S domain-containing protein [Planctomycetota bacterium]
MDVLDHWHPVLPTSLLQPGAVVGVRLAGNDLVLFRNSNNEIGALIDHCPHRRMKLSLGKVYHDRLQCGYHGWTFDATGNGESPATPKLYACARHFEVLERFDAIWVRNAGADSQFPQFDVEGHYNVCNLYHQIKAPLELTVDNFCEIEHTPTTHAFFGYPLERMHEVEVEFKPTDTSVRVINRGPRKKISLFLRTLVGIGRDYVFMDDWTTYFSPVYSVYDHWWQCPKTGAQSRVRWRLYIFFVPVDASGTAIFTFAFTKSRYPGPAGGARLFRWLMRSQLDYEIGLDVKILEGLADKNPSIEGMKLSRFDRVLGLNRERIERIYRGNGVH